MFKKNRNKGFSHIASMPSIKIDGADEIEEIPLETFTTNNVRDLTATAGPQVRGNRNSRGGRWSPISISSDEDEEAMDTIENDLRGTIRKLLMLKIAHYFL